MLPGQIVRFADVVFKVVEFEPGAAVVAVRSDPKCSSTIGHDEKETCYERMRQNVADDEESFWDSARGLLRKMGYAVVGRFPSTDKL
jgi:hypothetical protein